MTANGQPLLQAVDVTVRQPDDFLVLDVVNLAVEAGETYCLLGTGGAGKTAVLHTFLGLLRPTAGRVSVAGIDAARDPMRVRSLITYIAKGASLYPSLTARQNVEFFVRLDARGDAFTKKDYYHAMRRVGIPERSFERPARDLGHAVSLLLWLAIGLLKKTPVLLIDEPTVGLDVYASVDFQEVLIEFREQGQALLVATGDVLLAGHIASRIGIMKEGRKTVELTQRELVERPLQTLYLEYMGRPSPLAPAAKDARA